jgi:glutathione-regulated potassium-efflux system ancillary protein KefF
MYGRTDVPQLATCKIDYTGGASPNPAGYTAISGLPILSFDRMTALPRILILYAHAAPRRSRVNRQLADAAATLPQVRLHDLYEAYPDFDIDVPAEQALLEAADLIVFQHPIQWYGMPALLKQWVDIVLEDGWAYGAQGTALHGKDFWLVATAGGELGAYQDNAYHGYSFDAFLPPFKQTAQLCGMRWLEPLILFGARQASDQAVEKHVAHYRARLQSYPDWGHSSA